VADGALGLGQTALNAIGAKQDAAAAKAAVQEGYNLLRAGFEDGLNAARRALGIAGDATGEGTANKLEKDAAEFAKPRKVDEHHLMTNKNKISRAAGGPFTQKFEELARRRGITLDDAINRVSLPGHVGPHPAYNAEVYRILSEATAGLEGKAFNKAFDKALAHIRNETLNSGSLLNQLATGK
jgi:protein-disulfide isomerase-like protein with CxxC motif